MSGKVRAWNPGVPMVREVYHAELDHKYPLHTHIDWTVMLVDAGAVSYDLGRSEHVASPRALTLLPPGVPHDGHSVHEGRGYRKKVLYLSSDWLGGTAPGRAVAVPTLYEERPQGIAAKIHQAIATPGDEMAAEYWVLALRDEVLAHLGTPASAPCDVPLARKLRDMIDDRLADTFTIAEAAGVLGTHPSHLARVFSQSFGIAPHQYQVGRRVDLARRLLIDGGRPADVAALTGFHDQPHLTRHFKRVLGVTPSQFAA